MARLEWRVPEREDAQLAVQRFVAERFGDSYSRAGTDPDGQVDWHDGEMRNDPGVMIDVLESHGIAFIYRELVAGSPYFYASGVNGSLSGAGTDPASGFDLRAQPQMDDNLKEIRPLTA